MYVYWDVDTTECGYVLFEDILSLTPILSAQIKDIANLATKRMSGLLCEWTSPPCMSQTLFDYVAGRVEDGKFPLQFEIIGVQRVDNTYLKERYQQVRAELFGRRIDDAGLPLSNALQEVWAFHGTNPHHIEKICTHSLRPFNHPVTGGAASGSGDTVYFGGTHLGVYVGVSVNYVAKYSNNGCPLEPGDVVSVIAFRMCPGREYHCEEIIGPVPLMEGFDSHVSREGHEWWLPRPHQLRPAYILRVRAFECPEDANCDDGW